MLNKDKSIDYGKELSLLLSSLHGWHMIMLCDRNKTIEKFMKKLFQLYLEHFQYHLQTVEIYSGDYFDILSSCIPLINDQIHDQWNAAICDCCNDNNRWLELCKLASIITAFHEMFQKHIGLLEDEHILQDMPTYFGEEISLSEILKNIPHNHWWWFNKRLSSASDEIIPPWIRFPRHHPKDPFWQDMGKTYLYSLWLPYWKTLSRYECRKLISRWPQPDEWRTFLVDPPLEYT